MSRPIPSSALTLLAALAGSVAAAGDPAPARASGNWFGLRDALERRGVTFELVVQGDHSANLAGGLRRGSAFRRPLVAALDVDGERLLGWKGARLHVGAQAHDGRHGGELVGDAQGFDNADAERLRQVHELWLEQTLLGDRVRLKLGKVDANSEFAHTEGGGEFLNSSAGFSPTIQGFPTYPDPATSLSLFVRPAGWLELGAGAFDGATHEGCHGRTGNRGPATLWGDPAALFLVGEAGARLRLGERAGRVAIGTWKHTGRFERRDGTASSGAVGLYAVLDQQLLPREGALGLFAQLGTADGQIAEIDRHLAIGLSSTGLVPGRGEDTLGVLVSSVRLAEGGRHETAIELFYGARLRPWLLLKPDVQVVLDPAGSMPHALVATLRASLSF